MGSYPQTFIDSLKFVLLEEGGLSDRSPEDDPGGLTNLGITQGTLDGYRVQHPEFPESVRELTRDQATAIYHDLYWDTCRCDEMPPPVAFVVFNAAVQSGPVRSAKLLQKALGVTQDGIVGQMTLSAAAKDPRNNVRNILREQMLFEVGLANWETNKRGWTGRLFGAAWKAATLATV